MTFCFSDIIVRETSFREIEVGSCVLQLQMLLQLWQNRISKDCSYYLIQIDCEVTTKYLSIVLRSS